MHFALPPPPPYEHASGLVPLVGPLLSASVFFFDGSSWGTDTFRHEGQPPWPPLPRAVLEGLPSDVQPFYQHAVLPPEEQAPPIGSHLRAGDIHTVDNV